MEGASSNLKMTHPPLRCPFGKVKHTWSPPSSAPRGMCAASSHPATKRRNKGTFCFCWIHPYKVIKGRNPQRFLLRKPARPDSPRQTPPFEGCSKRGPAKVTTSYTQWALARAARRPPGPPRALAPAGWARLEVASPSQKPRAPIGFP